MVAPLPEVQHEGVNNPFDRIAGQSAAAEAIRRFGCRAAAVDAPVLLLGESGTGKGVLARAIHDASPRARKPFVAINCAAVPDSLFESEFFGHVRGAFTGAQYAHKGLFEQAEGGTLFLDEIGELPVTVQAKLLTVLEDGYVRRVGAERIAQVNVRVISATARNLRDDVVRNHFRTDLFHRLSVLSFHIPALRERGDDVHELAFMFLQTHCARYQRGVCVFDPATLDFLNAYAWPGNIRELSNVVECAVVASAGAEVSVTEHMLLPRVYGDDERARIQDAIRAADGNRTAAAKALGMGRTTLWQRLKQLDGEQA
jgi:DNA-binding NtrC family response regulator